MAKKVEISKENYDKIKSIIKESSCMAVAYDKVEKEFNLNYDSAFRITQAVDNDYKYLKVI